MSIQPIQATPLVPQSLIAGPVEPRNLVDPNKSLGEQAVELLAKVQQNVNKTILEMGASPESKRKYLERLEAQREQARLERRARRREAMAEARAEEKERELAALQNIIEELEARANRLNIQA